MTTQPTGRKRVSQYLTIAWFTLVGLAAVCGMLTVLVPNEFSFVVGRQSTVAYVLAFVLLVAVAGLPLLVAAAVMSRKSGRDGPKSST